MDAWEQRIPGRGIRERTVSGLYLRTSKEGSVTELRTPSGKSETVSCGVTVAFSWVLVHKVLLCPPRLYFPNLCKFWQHYVGVNGDLVQEDLCHIHTQSLCPCGRPLLTHISTGDAQTQFCLSLCGVPGSWCAQVLFEPSESLLDCKEIQPARSEGDQPWDFFGRNDAKAETPVLWPPHAKS